MRMGARQQSLEAAGYLVGENGELERNAEGRYIKIDRDLLGQMRSERREPDKNFKDISVDLLDPSAWKRVEQGRWFHKDAIHNLAARALTKACARLGNVSIFTGLEFVMLGDKLAVTLAHARLGFSFTDPDPKNA